MAWYTLSKKFHQEVAQEIERLKNIKPTSEGERDWTECKIRRHKETRMFPPMAKAIETMRAQGNNTSDITGYLHWIIRDMAREDAEQEDWRRKHGDPTPLRTWGRG